VSLEIVYETDQTIDPSVLLESIAVKLGAEPIQPMEGSRYVRTSGMGVWCSTVGGDEPSYRELRLGFPWRSEVMFRLEGTATVEERDVAWAQILSIAIDLAEQYGGRAVLLFNGEHVLMCSDGVSGVVVDVWDGLDEVPELAPILATRTRRRLDQPLMG
jgi:hypothetical protein